MTSKILTGEDFEWTLPKLGVGEFLFTRAEQFKNNICQVDIDSHETETYGSIKERSVRLAINLQKKGITTEDVIAICSFNSIDNAIPMLAALYLGAKVANLSTVMSPRNFTYLLKQITPTIFFVQEETLEFVEICLHDINPEIEIIIIGNSSKYTRFSELLVPAANEKLFKPVKVELDDTAVLFFSSGTTGTPKVVCHSHRTLLSIVDITCHSGYPMESILHYTTFYWISGVFIFARCFVNGVTRLFGRNPDGRKIFEAIEKYKISSAFLAPIATYELSNVEKPEKFDYSSFRCLLTGGTPMAKEQFIRLKKLFSNAEVIFGYGMTEVGCGAIFNMERDKDLIATKTGSCGKTAPKTMIKFVDVDTEEVLGPNKVGELRIKTASMLKEYYKEDSYHCYDSDGFFKTGDTGYYDEDECIYVIERIKEVFKYLSWPIIPTVIENVLLEHPAVKEAVVFGIPKGDLGELPTACIVLKKGYNVDKEEIEQFVEKRISDKEKLRGGIIFVTSLPRTPSGKPIRQEIRNMVINSA